MPYKENLMRKPFDGEQGQTELGALRFGPENLQNSIKFCNISLVENLWKCEWKKSREKEKNIINRKTKYK